MMERGIDTGRESVLEQETKDWLGLTKFEREKKQKKKNSVVRPPVRETLDFSESVIKSMLIVYLKKKNRLPEFCIKTIHVLIYMYSYYIKELRVSRYSKFIKEKLSLFFDLHICATFACNYSRLE